MTTRSLLFSVLLALAGGCGKGWRVDYGEPAAQFLQADLPTKGKAFLGSKITIKGTVAKVDVSNPKAAYVHLGGGIRCNMGTLAAMAKSCTSGETVCVDGMLVRCNPGDVLVEPAVLRDPAAPFSPHP